MRLARRHRAGHRRGRRLAAVRPLHGAGAVRAGARLLRRGDRQFGAVSGVGQRLRHRAGADAAVRPRARAAGARRRLHAVRQRRGLGVRRRLGRAGRAAARRARRARAALHDRRSVGRAARRQRERLAALRRPGALARRAGPMRCTAWSSATRCSTRCRCSCCISTAQAGSSAASRSARRDRRFAFADRPTALRPPHDEPRFAPGTATEIHPQAEAFVATLATRLQRGAAFFIDYGFPEAEYYHPQRTGGTLMCHRAHLADSRPAGRRGRQGHHRACRLHRRSRSPAQDAGLDVLGYTSQARFLMNCGLLDDLRGADARALSRRRSCSTSTRWASCSR